MKRAPELAEAIGTFALVLVGCGSMFVSGLTGAPGPVGIGVEVGQQPGTDATSPSKSS